MSSPRNTLHKAGEPAIINHGSLLLNSGFELGTAGYACGLWLGSAVPGTVHPPWQRLHPFRRGLDLTGF
ncbi:dopamine beta-monooxygenase precursor [Corchorus olitorius]|uniref:Dopamine beta-monooxygenase n=1 Tax=Corchorus olitorius TaxID=93759 RepID=A0A1R3IHI9_9ROSI|nr:dopamine beta-monooxygenase precursor [Corchorus olitorius]